MDGWKKIEEGVSLTQNLSFESSLETVNVMQKTLGLYAHALSLIKTTEEPKVALVRMSLVSQNLNTLSLAVDSAIMGYYIQSMILLRNVYENWLAFWYLAKFPGDAEIWLDPNRYPLKAETMRNKVEFVSHETKAKLHDFRSELNRFNHTDSIAVLSRLRKDREKTFVRSGVEFHPVELDACASSILFWSANMLIAMNSWIPKNHEDWHISYKSILDEIVEFQDKFYSSQNKARA